VCALLTVNYAMLATMTTAGLALLPAKVLTEAALFVASYTIQRRFVFAATRRGTAGPREEAGQMDVSTRSERRIALGVSAPSAPGC
jgi:hypothetical protein